MYQNRTGCDSHSSVSPLVELGGIHFCSAAGQLSYPPSLTHGPPSPSLNTSLSPPCFLPLSFPSFFQSLSPPSLPPSLPPSPLTLGFISQATHHIQQHSDERPKVPCGSIILNESLDQWRNGIVKETSLKSGKISIKYANDRVRSFEGVRDYVTCHWGWAIIRVPAFPHT